MTVSYWLSDSIHVQASRFGQKASAPQKVIFWSRKSFGIQLFSAGWNDGQINWKTNVMIPLYNAEDNGKVLKFLCRKDRFWKSENQKRTLKRSKKTLDTTSEPWYYTQAASQESSAWTLKTIQKRQTRKSSERETDKDSDSREWTWTRSEETSEAFKIQD